MEFLSDLRRDTVCEKAVYMYLIMYYSLFPLLKNNSKVINSMKVQKSFYTFLP